MISKEKRAEIWEKLGADEAAQKLFDAQDVQGLLAKCKECGFDVTEGDIAELFVEDGEVSKEELNAIAGGGCGDRILYGPCGKNSCHSDNY